LSAVFTSPPPYLVPGAQLALDVLPLVLVVPPPVPVACEVVLSPVPVVCEVVLPPPPTAPPEEHAVREQIPAIARSRARSMNVKVVMKRLSSDMS
jgi:hypothetical protein